jgi:choice-of-anchor C domain-containing protein
MKKTLIAGLVTLGLMGGMCGTAGANLILNGSFESGTYTDGGSGFQTLFESSGSSIANWDVVGGSIDWIGSYWVASDDLKSIDLAGNAPGLIVGTSFETVIGQTYRVQFDMAGNPDRSYEKSLRATASSGGAGADHVFTFNQTNHTHTDMGWETMSFDFVAGDTISQLYFNDETTVTDNGGAFYGAALDNVSVDLAPVPEPSTLLLLGAGLAGLGIFGRRLRRSSKK